MALADKCARISAMAPSSWNLLSGDPFSDLSSDVVERAMTLRNGLVALCEGKTSMSDAVYRLLRREFMSDSDVGHLVPKFVRTAQDKDAIWAYLKDFSPQWAPRRQFVRDQFAALIDKLEGVDLAVNVAPQVDAVDPATPMLAKSDIVNLASHRFDVALSFPGEVRPLVKEVAACLEQLLGPHTYFYDDNYTSQLARPSLDTFLQGIYRQRAKLIVVFLSSDYQQKKWCGIEFRAIRDIIANRENSRIMFVRTDDGQVEGVFATDGYVDARLHNAAVIARFIQERSQLP